MYIFKTWPSTSMAKYMRNKELIDEDFTSLSFTSKLLRKGVC